MVFFGLGFGQGVQASDERYRARRLENLRLWNEFVKNNPEATLGELSAFAEQLSGGENYLRGALPSGSVLAAIASENERRRREREQDRAYEMWRRQQEQTNQLRSLAEQMLSTVDDPDRGRELFLKTLPPEAQSSPLVRSFVEGFGWAETHKRLAQDRRLREATQVAQLAQSFYGADEGTIRRELANMPSAVVEAVVANVQRANQQREMEHRDMMEKWRDMIADNLRADRQLDHTIDVANRATLQAISSASMQDPAVINAIQSGEPDRLRQLLKEHAAKMGMPHITEEQLDGLLNTALGLGRTLAQERAKTLGAMMGEALGNKIKAAADNNFGYLQKTGEAILKERGFSGERAAAMNYAAMSLAQTHAYSSPEQILSDVIAVANEKPELAKDSSALLEEVKRRTRAQLIEDALYAAKRMSATPIDAERFVASKTAELDEVLGAAALLAQRVDVGEIDRHRGWQAAQELQAKVASLKSQLETITQDPLLFYNYRRTDLQRLVDDTLRAERELQSIFAHRTWNPANRPPFPRPAPNRAEPQPEPTAFQRGLLRGGARMPPAPSFNNIVGRTPEGRPIVLNPDGSYSTERSVTVEVGGRFVNIPTMFGGREVSPQQALRLIQANGWVDPETGRQLEFYQTLEEAEAAARARSNSIAVPR